MRRQAFIIVLAVLITGCGRAPQIAPVNRRAMQGLQTAVSSRKVEWLEAAVRLIEEQRSEGEMEDDEYEVFQKIVEKARSGDWSGAQHDAFALVEGQRPTPEDLASIKPARAN
jgi:Sec-independent protein translocase protein TatA